MKKKEKKGKRKEGKKEGRKDIDFGNIFTYTHTHSYKLLFYEKWLFFIFLPFSFKVSKFLSSQKKRKNLSSYPKVEICEVQRKKKRKKKLTDFFSHIGPCNSKKRKLPRFFSPKDQKKNSNIFPTYGFTIFIVIFHPFVLWVEPFFYL